jgi:hypothetical protein
MVSSGKNKETISENHQSKRVAGIAQVVECLPSKCGALS